MSDLKYRMQEQRNSPQKKSRKNPCTKPSRDKALMIRKHDKYLDNYFYYTEVFKDLK